MTGKRFKLKWKDEIESGVINILFYYNVLIKPNPNVEKIQRDLRDLGFIRIDPHHYIQPLEISFI